LGEYLHYAIVAANGGVYAGYDSIGFAGGRNAALGADPFQTGVQNIQVFA